MKKLLFLAALMPLWSSAQNLYVSGRLGFANYQGDLKAKSISFSQGKLLGSLGARYDFTEHISARSYITLTGLQADDSRGTPSMHETLTLGAKGLKKNFGTSRIFRVRLEMEETNSSEHIRAPPAIIKAEKIVLSGQFKVEDLSSEVEVSFLH